LISTGHQSLGLYYSTIGENEIAKDEYLKVLKIGKENGYKLYELAAITNLSSLEMAMGNPRVSDSLSAVALKLAKEELILYAVSPIYWGMSFSLMEEGDFEGAMEMLDSSRLYMQYSFQSEIPFLNMKYQIYERNQCS